jgi:hypothetical protein
MAKQHRGRFDGADEREDLPTTVRAERARRDKAVPVTIPETPIRSQRFMGEALLWLALVFWRRGCVSTPVRGTAAILTALSRVRRDFCFAERKLRTRAVQELQPRGWLSARRPSAPGAR